MGFLPLLFSLISPYFGQRERITGRRQQNRSPFSSPFSLTDFPFHTFYKNF